MAITRLKLAEIREMTDVELRAKIAEYQKERAGLRFKAATEVLANPMDLRTARRTVARLNTVLAERARAKKAATA
jgi:large subunit ribosomal protein L29